MTGNLRIKGRLNGSQVRLGVKSDHVEHRDASCGDIECYGKDVVNPRHMVIIQGTTADEKRP